MKQFFLMAAMAMCLAEPLQAKAKYQYGPKVGPTASSLYGLQDVAKKASTLLRNSGDSVKLSELVRGSLHAGAYFERSLTDRFSMGLECIYLRLGVPHPKFTVKISYFSFPIYVLYYPWGGPEGWSVYGGPAFNFSWNNEELKMPAVDERNNALNFIRPIEIAILGGLQYRWANGVSLQLRYSRGLTDIFDWYPNPTVCPFYLKDILLTNQSLQISVTYNLARLLPNAVWPWTKTTSSAHGAAAETE